MAGSGEGQGGAITHAVIRPVTDATGATMAPSARSAEAVTVHFNPEKLDITLTNNLRQGAGANPAQLTDEAKAQLSVDLMFDTTITGNDVRGVTDGIARFLKPSSASGQSPEQKAPPPRVVEFDWGAILFQGYIDRYSESLDFFSHDGVPLRATVSLSLTQQERTFAPRQAAGGGGFAAGGVGADPFGGGGFELSIGLDLPMATPWPRSTGLKTRGFQALRRSRFRRVARSAWHRRLSRRRERGSGSVRARASVLARVPGSGSAGGRVSGCRPVPAGRPRPSPG
jgi:hypothetical protein